MGYGSVNPKNMMPTNLPQTPAEGQQKPLSTDRVSSSIPTTSGATWKYPSPQQFFNALKRKEKNPEEDAMDSVVYVHNFVNEETWKKVLDWELKQGCTEPSLLRFHGRSEELSPLARVKQLWLGRPFDRHDWYIDRCGTGSVRYIIDYYDAPSEDGLDIQIDVRPALDSLSAAWTRMLRLFN